MQDDIDDLKTENEGLRASMGKELSIGSALRRLLRLLRACLGGLGGSSLPGVKAAPLGAQPLPRALGLATSK